MQASHCAEVEPCWIYEYVPSAAPSGIFWHDKDFPKSSEVDAEAGEAQPEFIRWLMMPSQMAWCFHNVFMITSELRDSVRSAVALSDLTRGPSRIKIWLNQTKEIQNVDLSLHSLELGINMIWLMQYQDGNLIWWIGMFNMMWRPLWWSG